MNRGSQSFQGKSAEHMTWLDSAQICVSNTLPLKNQIGNGKRWGYTHEKRHIIF